MVSELLPLVIGMPVLVVGIVLLVIGTPVSVSGIVLLVIGTPVMVVGIVLMVKRFHGIANDPLGTAIVSHG